MITNDNYFKTYQSLNAKEIPEGIRAMHEVIGEAVEQFDWEFVDEDEILLKDKELLFEKLGKLLQNSGITPPKKEKPSPNPRQPRARASAPAKPAQPERKSSAKEKPETKSSPKADIELVRDLDIELRLIGRFVNLHKKPKTYTQVLNVFNAINRAVKKGQVRKTQNPTPHHKEIQWIQDKLATALQKAYSGKDLDELAELSFDQGYIDKLQAIRKSYQVYPSVRLGLRYLGMEGKAPETSKASNLLKAIETAKTKDKYPKNDLNSGFLDHAAKSLRDYLESKSATIHLKKSELSGLAGAVLGCGCKSSARSQLNTVVNHDSNEYIIAPHRGEAVQFRSDDLPSAHDNVYAFSGRWAELLNQPIRGFSALIYGKPKSGKSTLAADLGGYLASNFGSVLYASIEEGARGTITERIERLGVGHPRMTVSNYLPTDLSGYDFVITDSVSRGRLDLEQIRSLIAANPDTSFLFIFHVTKAGLPRGTTEFQHEVDVLVEVTEGVAVANGRFGPGEMAVRFE